MSPSDDDFPFWYAGEEAVAHIQTTILKLVNDEVGAALRDYAKTRDDEGRTTDSFFFVGEDGCIHFQMDGAGEIQAVSAPLAELIIDWTVDYNVGPDGKFDPNDMAKVLVVKTELEKALAAIAEAMPDGC